MIYVYFVSKYEEDTHIKVLSDNCFSIKDVQI